MSSPLNFADDKNDTNIRMKDVLHGFDCNMINSFKDKVVDQLKEQATTHKDMINDTLKHTNNIYKSKILNDLYVRISINILDEADSI